MRYAITFIVAVVACFLIEVSNVRAVEPLPVTGETWTRAGLQPLEMRLDLEQNTGVMLVAWSGDYPLEAYENRWLQFSLYDHGAGSSVSFDMWLATWVGVCDAPCKIEVDFIIRNVNVVTE